MCYNSYTDLGHGYYAVLGNVSSQSNFQACSYYFGIFPAHPIDSWSRSIFTFCFYIIYWGRGVIMNIFPLQWLASYKKKLLILPAVNVRSIGTFHMELNKDRGKLFHDRDCFNQNVLSLNWQEEETENLNIYFQLLLFKGNIFNAFPPFAANEKKLCRSRMPLNMFLCYSLMISIQAEMVLGPVLTQSVDTTSDSRWQQRWLTSHYFGGFS